MALLATYQVRELSTSAVELWALRALRGEVITRSTTYYSLLTTYHSLLTTYYVKVNGRRFTLDIMPGWKAGTKINYDDANLTFEVSSE